MRSGLTATAQRVLVAARLDGLAELADKMTTTVTAGTTAPAPDATDTALRAHVEAQDAATGVRLAAAEAGSRATITVVDDGLRAHAQEAVAQTQFAGTSLGEKVHLLEVARSLSGDTGAVALPPDGRCCNAERTGLEVTALRQRLSELELKVRANELATTEQKAVHFTTERDLSMLESQLGSTTNVSGEATTGRV